MINQKKIRLISVAIIFIAIVSLIYYAGTHGRIVIKNPSDETVSIVRINDMQRSEIINIKNGAIVSAGTYIVNNAHHDQDRSAYIKVPGWFQANEITFTTTDSPKVSRIAGLTYENFFPSDDGSLVSFSDINNYVPGYTTHPEGDVFGGNYTDTIFDKELYSPIITSEGKLLGIHDAQLLKYSFSSKSIEKIGNRSLAQPTRIEAEKDITLMPELKRSSDVNSSHVGIYEKATNTLSVLNTSGKIVSHEIKVNNSRNIVFDVNGNGMAIVNTTSKTPTNATPDLEGTPLKYSISIYDTNQVKKSDLNVGEAISVTNIALSPSNKHIAVLKDNELWIYDTTDNRVVMVHPFTTINQMFWNKNKLYALSSDSGMNVFDTDTMQLLTMSFIHQDSLSFSVFYPIGNKLYTTAFNTKQESRLPDGYIFDLDVKSDGITGTLAEKLPINKNDYDINYIGNTIYIRINYYPGNGSSEESIRHMNNLKKRAETELSEIIPSDILKKSNISFVN